MDALRLFQACFPSDFRAKEAFELLVESPLTEGHAQAALEACPRLRPFSERTIQRYLSSLEGAPS
jgi:hypothetical protein